MLLVLLLQASPAAAYLKAYAPFTPGKEPARVPLRECFLIRETIPDDDPTRPTLKVFAPTKNVQTPLITMQRSESGWEITLTGKDGSPLLAHKDDKDRVNQVYTADFNGDGTPDFLINTWSAAAGLAAEGSNAIFLLSDGRKYKAHSFYTFDFTPEDLIRLKRRGPCYFIHTQLLGNDGEKTRDGAHHNFWVYQLYRIDRTALTRTESDSRQFPMWIWYSFKDNHRETDLLTPEQKKRLLKKFNTQR